jgi:orotate phosphoribosyltransferase
MTRSSPTDAEVKDLLTKRGALREGHFRLSSGLHSGTFLQTQAVLQYPEDASRLGAALAARVSDLKPTAVLGPALGAIILAHEVARALGARSLFAERGATGAFELRRGQGLLASDRVVVVENVVTTGGSVREVLKLLEEVEVPAQAVVAVVDRSEDGNPLPEVRFERAVRVEAPAFPPDDCPWCRQGLPLEAPGSRHISRGPGGGGAAS